VQSFLLKIDSRLYNTLNQLDIFDLYIGKVKRKGKESNGGPKGKTPSIQIKVRLHVDRQGI
jgi:hypothetical protein